MPTLLNKSHIKLINSLHKKKYRQKYQMFILEGEKLVNEALRDKPEIVEYIITPYHNSFSSHLPVKIYTANERVYSSLSTLVTPPPVMAVCKFLKSNESPMQDLKNSFSFYLDNINDPGNFGTIIRICDWFGIPQIYASPSTVELYNPKTIQASKGSFLRVNVVYIEYNKLVELFKNKINIYGADVNGESIYELKNKTGLVILGNESHGISDNIKNQIHKRISIPKKANSKANSLNVAMSAAIIASEFSRCSS